jgi:serine protease Do
VRLRTRTLLWTAAGLMMIGAAVGFATTTAPQHLDPAATESSHVESATSLLEPILPISAPNYREIVRQNQEAVVGITTSGRMDTSSGTDGFGNPFDNNNPLSQFFRGLPMPQNRGLMHAQGSGFIVTTDGIVLTNAHVVEGAQNVTVKLSDHREFKAKVLGSDRGSDIAVLKINAHDLPTVRLGDSDKLGVGDYVLAIGEPFGLEETATAGIVSAKGRSLPGDGYVPFIQTDAAVNPGNSGGPLFDSTGAVVGINAQIYSNTGGYQGVSFAIPINLAVQIKDQIVKTGKVVHARLGVQVQSLNQALAGAFKLKVPNGALIAKVEPDSAAAQAGLRVGDVILKVDGTPIIDAGQLSARVGAHAPGDKSSLEIWRDGKALTVTVTIARAMPLSAGDASESPQVRLGLTLRPLTQDERNQTGVSAGGLVVDDAQGPAVEAGIQPGDIILSVDGTSLQTVAQLSKIVREHDKLVALLIQRGSGRLFVPVTLG